jgi:uncharacterized protein YndB with AHSA1/START domain
MTDRLPTHPVDATLLPDGERWTLHMTRALDQPPDVVWTALTDASRLPQWVPFAPDRDLDATGDVGLPVIGDPASTAESSRGSVVHVEAPRMLSYLWGDDLVGFVLAGSATGTTLHLTHTFDDREAASSMAAGWHLCLAALDGFLDGLDLTSVAGEAAMDHGWPELNQRYAALFREQAVR